MNITLTIPDSALPAWNLRLKQFNDGSGKDPISLDEFLQLMHDEQTAQHVACLKAVQLEALKAVGEQIIAAPAEKQQAAINAALAAIA